MTTTPITIRSATSEDARFIWELNNHPSVREQSFSTEEIPWEGHLRWYERRLSTPTALTFIVDEAGTPAAVVRFDLETDHAVIGIAVDPARRGRGVGARSIALAAQTFAASHPGCRVVAWVRVSNEASIGAFRRAGFARVGATIRDGIPVEQLER